MKFRCSCTRTKWWRFARKSCTRWSCHVTHWIRCGDSQWRRSWSRTPTGRMSCAATSVAWRTRALPCRTVSTCVWRVLYFECVWACVFVSVLSYVSYGCQQINACLYVGWIESTLLANVFNLRIMWILIFVFRIFFVKQIQFVYYKQAALQHERHICKLWIMYSKNKRFIRYTTYKCDIR